MRHRPAANHIYRFTLENRADSVTAANYIQVYLAERADSVTVTSHIYRFTWQGGQTV